MNFTKLFKRKPKILALNWSDPLQARKVASHRVLQIDDKYFYRKDEVERLMQEVIHLKVNNGDLAVVKKNDKLKIKN